MTHRPLRSIVVAGALVLSALPAGAAASTHLHACSENMQRISDLAASEGTSCRRARRVSRRYDRKLLEAGQFPGNGVILSRGYKCRAEKIGYETYKVRCRRDDSLVRFLWGV